MSHLVQIDSPKISNLAAEQKESLLLQNLAALPSVIVALSGGADSAYLAWAAHTALAQNALSITAVSPSFSAHDRSMVEALISQLNLHHQFVATHEMDNPAYRANNPDRCYFCKDELFSTLDAIARTRSIPAIVYGVNADDTLDFRPGHRAATEHKALAPLLDAALTKSEIRALSKRAGISTWDRPASACLSSRLPYGTAVTAERLSLVERGEAALRDLGFSQFRVRLYDQSARVEIAVEEMPRAFTPQMSQIISQRLIACGFQQVSLDPRGYRQGSLNEALPLVAASVHPPSGT